MRPRTSAADGLRESLQLGFPLDPGPPAPAAPLVKWAGGKRGLWTELEKFIPTSILRYFEPFLGGGSVFLRVDAASYVVNDANEELMAMYRAVRDSPDRVAERLDALQPFVANERVYYDLRAQDPSDLAPPDRAARFIFLNKAGYNGLYRVNRRGKFNVPFGRHSSPPRLYVPANLRAAAERLRRAELRSGDFQPVMADAGPGDFVYVDPPYVPLTATANFTKYTASEFGESDQVRLADAVEAAVSRGATVLVSNSDTSLVRRLYGTFDAHVVMANRHINSNAAGRKGIAELLIRASQP